MAETVVAGRSKTRSNGFVILTIFAMISYKTVMASLNVSMPDELRQFVDKRTKEGHFSTPTEYVRHLIREDQKRRAEDRLERLLLESLDSGDFEEVTPEFFNRLRSLIKKHPGGKRKRQ